MAKYNRHISEDQILLARPQNLLFVEKWPALNFSSLNVLLIRRFIHHKH